MEPADAAHAARVRKSTLLYVYGEPESRSQRKKVWRRSATELACKLRDDWEAGGKIKAKTLNAALTQACDRWVRPDGRRFSPESLYELLRKKDHKMRGNPL